MANFFKLVVKELKSCDSLTGDNPIMQSINLTHNFVHWTFCIIITKSLSMGTSLECQSTMWQKSIFEHLEQN